MEEHTLPEAARYSIAYASGDTAVVLFHGLTGTPSEMSDMADSLHAKGYTVYVPCLAGHCSSIEDLRTISHTTWLQEVDSFFQHISQRQYSRIIVGGLSFGSLLALYVAGTYPEKIAAVIALSVPLRFRSEKRELILTLLSYLPDLILDTLPTVDKIERPDGIFARPRFAYPQHSVAAAARVVKVRRKMLAQLKRVVAPVLLLQDPLDHHLAPRVPFLFRKVCKAGVRFRWFPEGHHELTLGHSYQEVIEEIVSFVTEHTSIDGDSEE